MVPCGSTCFLPDSLWSPPASFWKKPFFCGCFFAGSMYTDAAAFEAGFADAALLRVLPLRTSSLVYRSFIGLRVVMVLLGC